MEPSIYLVHNVLKEEKEGRMDEKEGRREEEEALGEGRAEGRQEKRENLEGYHWLFKG